MTLQSIAVHGEKYVQSYEVIHATGASHIFFLIKILKKIGKKTCGQNIIAFSLSKTVIQNILKVIIFHYSK